MTTELNKSSISQLNLAQRDHYLKQITEIIEAKKQLLMDKQKKLKKEEKGNDFLKKVREDYKTYYTYIIQEKKKQYNAMAVLKKYIDELIISENLTDDKILDAKKEQKIILEELNTIKESLDNLIRETI
jgi:glutamyl-tRNA reductase